MDDWLGTGEVADGPYRSFKKARDFVRRRGLKSKTEWSGYSKSGKKPVDVPANPNNMYAHAGWSIGAIGLGPVEFAARVGDPSFEARAFVRNRRLKSIGMERLL